MAWRPNDYFKLGELDNTVLGKVKGWMEFAGLNERVLFALEGDFHRDIRGTKIVLKGEGGQFDGSDEARRYMDGFSMKQTGQAGDITGGFEPADYVRGYVYVEWYAENGRVVLELEQSQIEVIGKPIPAQESFPVSRQKQQENMAKFLGQMVQDLNIPSGSCICVGMASPKRDSSDGHVLLTDEVRKLLPPLYSQDGKGGKAIAQVKFFTPDSNWTWLATEFDGDDTFFGLVLGFEKEMGYFSLAELENTKGPLGLSIERDLHWQPKSLDQVAPELFS